MSTVRRIAAALAGRHARHVITDVKDYSGTVTIYRDTAGEYRWSLQANNGQVVAHGEGYTRPADAWQGWLAVRRIAERPRVIDTTRGA